LFRHRINQDVASHVVRIGIDDPAMQCGELESLCGKLWAALDRECGGVRSNSGISARSPLTSVNTHADRFSAASNRADELGVTERGMACEGSINK
jgi:hypothetical protein